VWSKRSDLPMTWEKAIEYCSSLSESGQSDWKLPEIDQLRTLITNCPATETAGLCRITDECAEDSCWSSECISCPLAIDGRYSKFGDKGEFWSATSNSSNDNFAWYIGFFDGLILDGNKENEIFVRCTR
jgi:hypothetical protein